MEDGLTKTAARSLFSATLLPSHLMLIKKRGSSGGGGGASEMEGHNMERLGRRTQDKLNAKKNSLVILNMCIYSPICIGSCHFQCVSAKSGNHS